MGSFDGSAPENPDWKADIEAFVNAVNIKNSVDGVESLIFYGTKQAVTSVWDQLIVSVRSSSENIMVVKTGSAFYVRFQEVLKRTFITQKNLSWQTFFESVVNIAENLIDQQPAAIVYDMVKLRK